MTTRRARFYNSIARAAGFGALAIAIAFGAFALDAVPASAANSDAQHAVVVPHEARPNVAIATSTQLRGNAWFASLVAACVFGGLGGYALRGLRRAGRCRTFPQYSIRLRAPPSLPVAH